MDDEIKVSELPQASQVNAADLLMIIQGGANKKIPFATLNEENDSRLDAAETDVDNLETRMAAVEERNIMTLNKNTTQSITQNTNPQQVTFNSSIKTGTKLTFSNNSIKIGPGITKILGSACCWANAISGYKWLTLRRKRGTSYATFGQVITPLNTSETWDSVVIPPVLIDVQENDEISIWLAITGTAAGAIESGTYQNSTFLTVEVVEEE